MREESSREYRDTIDGLKLSRYDNKHGARYNSVTLNFFSVTLFFLFFFFFFNEKNSRNFSLFPQSHNIYLSPSREIATETATTIKSEGV